MSMKSCDELIRRIEMAAESGVQVISSLHFARSQTTEEHAK